MFSRYAGAGWLAPEVCAVPADYGGTSTPSDDAEPDQYSTAHQPSTEPSARAARAAAELQHQGPAFTEAAASARCRWVSREFCILTFFKKNILEDISPFSWATDTPVFGLMVTTALGFKAGVDLSLVCCFVACVWWIPQIHLWCDTSWPLGSQHGSRTVFWSTFLAQL